MGKLKSRFSVIKSIADEMLEEANGCYKPEFGMLRQSDDDFNYTTSSWIAVINYYASKAYVFSSKTDEGKRKEFIRCGGVAINAVLNLYHGNRRNFMDCTIEDMNLYIGECISDTDECLNNVGYFKMECYNTLYNPVKPYEKYYDLFQFLGSSNDVYQKKCYVEIIVSGETAVGRLTGYKSAFNSTEQITNFKLFQIKYDINSAPQVVMMKAFLRELITSFFVISELEIQNRPRHFHEDMMNGEEPFACMKKTDNFGTITGERSDYYEVRAVPDRLETYSMMDVSGHILGTSFTTEAYTDKHNLIENGFAYTAYGANDTVFDMGLNGKYSVLNDCFDSVSNPHNGSYRICVSRGFH